LVPEQKDEAKEVVFTLVNFHSFPIPSHHIRQTLTNMMGLAAGWPHLEQLLLNSGANFAQVPFLKIRD
jgi:hypothetical protein